MTVDLKGRVAIVTGGVRSGCARYGRSVSGRRSRLRAHR
jgi:hypothetical protein